MAAAPVALARRAGADGGFGLIELLVAMTVLVVGIGAVLSLYVSTAVSLRRAARKGTAVTLVDRQLEAYRIGPFASIRIDGTRLPGAADPYTTGHDADTTIPAATDQALAGANGDATCPSASPPPACLPVQTVTGPDGRSYRVDTYVEYVNADATLSHRAPAAGLRLKRVTVVVRDGTSHAILARASSAFPARSRRRTRRRPRPGSGGTTHQEARRRADAVAMTVLLALAPFAALAALFGWLSDVSAAVPANAVVWAVCAAGCVLAGVTAGAALRRVQ